MATSHAKTTFSPLSIALHWISALLIVIILLIGYFAESPELWFFHKSFGLLIFVFTVLRLFALYTHPAYSNSMPLWEKISARTVKYLMYIILLLMPLTGWVFTSAAGYIPSFFGLFLLPAPAALFPLAGLARETHEILPYVLMALIVLHVLAALKHHWIDKDRLVKRMIG